jgi:hypothetical protein
MDYHNPSGNNRFWQAMRQAEDVEGGQVQVEEHNLASGGLLSMISPVSDTFK